MSKGDGIVTSTGGCRPAENNIVKLVVIGDSGVGKSQLLSRFVRGQFSDSFEPTVGLDFAVKSVTLDSRVVRVQLWDLAGRPTFRNLTSSYYQGTTAALVVYDITKVRSFENAARWLDNLRSQSNCAAAMLIGNKLDLRSQRSVPSSEGLKFAKANNSLFLETSALDCTNVQKAFHRLVEHASEQMARGIPAAEIAAKSALENGARSLHNASSLPPPTTVIQRQPKKRSGFRKTARECVEETKVVCSKLPCCMY